MYKTHVTIQCRILSDCEFPVEKYGLVGILQKAGNLLVKRTYRTVLWNLLFCAVLVAGCATKEMKVKDPGAVDLSSYQRVLIEVSAADGVKLPDAARDRISDWLGAAFSESSPNALPREVTTEPGPNVLILQVTVTKYDPGNAFLRFMLAGLGSIKVYGDVHLKDSDSDAILLEDAAGRRWAWGGLVGGMGRPPVAEEQFVDAVVRGLKKLDWTKAPVTAPDMNASAVDESIEQAPITN